MNDILGNIQKSGWWKGWPSLSPRMDFRSRCLLSDSSSLSLRLSLYYSSWVALAVKLPYKQRQRHTYNTRALLAIASSLTKTTTTMTASLNTYFSSLIPMALVIKGRHTIFVVKVENVLWGWPHHALMRLLMFARKKLGGCKGHKFLSLVWLSYMLDDTVK